MTPRTFAIIAVLAAASGSLAPAWLAASAGGHVATTPPAAVIVPTSSPSLCAWKRMNSCPGFSCRWVLRTACGSV